MDAYEAIGGMAGCRGLAETFYRRASRDKVLARMFPGSLRCATEALTRFMAQILGGPPEYSEHRWHLSLREAHERFAIGPAERDAWVRNMLAILRELEMPEELRSVLAVFFRESAGWVEGQGEKAACPHAGIAARWEGQKALDAAVTAMRGGDCSAAVALAESGALDGDPAVLVGLLALPGNREYCARRVRRQPDLVRARHARGRTLLHDAAAAGDLELMQLLLDLGADPNSATYGGHSPLYCLGNQCRSKTGAAAVHLLVAAGAEIRGGELHMAARRGSVGIAAALLECGAEIDWRERSGETALRRAVNCGKTEVAALLVARGADPDSRDRKGKTPRMAARSAAMEALFVQE